MPIHRELLSVYHEDPQGLGVLQESSTGALVSSLWYKMYLLTGGVIPFEIGTVDEPHGNTALPYSSLTQHRALMLGFPLYHSLPAHLEDPHEVDKDCLRRTQM